MAREDDAVSAGASGGGGALRPMRSYVADIVRVHWGRLVARAQRALRSGEANAEELAADVIGDIFMTPLGDALRPPEKALAFVENTIAYRARHILRRASRLQPVHDNLADPAGMSWRHLARRILTRRRLRAALKRLKKPERHAIVLFHLRGLNCEEIAKREGASPQTIRKRLSRARRRLRALLGARW